MSSDGIQVSKATIEKAIVAHMFGDALSSPETRDAVLQDLVLKVITAQDRSYGPEGDTLLQSTIKSALKERIKEITQEWLDLPGTRQLLEDQVAEVLKTQVVQAMITGTAKSLSERLAKGY